MKDRTPEEKLDLILANQETIKEGIGLILMALTEDPPDDDLETMEPVGPVQ